MEGPVFQTFVPVQGDSFESCSDIAHEISREIVNSAGLSDGFHCVGNIVNFSDIETKTHGYSSLEDWQSNKSCCGHLQAKLLN